jgi:Zn-dependent protease
MKLKVASLFGIPIYVHWTFLLLLCYGLLVWWYYPVTFWDGFWLALFTLSLFICVVFHELGHALMARKYGVATIDIILSPIGGVARLDKLPEHPIQELMVALAGPLVNLFISALLLPFYILMDPTTRMDVWGLVTGDPNTFLLSQHYGQIFIVGLLILNIVLALFNLIPAFPMDGGRMVRALLTWPFGRLKAPVMASVLAQFLAFLFFFYGMVSSNYMLSIIGIFVFLTAQRERKLVVLEQKLRQATIKEVILPKILKWTLNESPQEDKPPTHDPMLLIDKWNNPLGIIHKNNISPIQRFLSPEINLQKAISIIGKSELNQQPIAVWEKGRVVALLTFEEIEAWVVKN